MRILDDVTLRDARKSSSKSIEYCLLVRYRTASEV
jgi:hypothetical protein